MLSPLTFLISAVTTFSTIAIWRYVSLGSIVGALTTMVCGIIMVFIGWVSIPTMIYLLIGPALVILLHHDNIGRLLAGTERKIGQKVTIENVVSPPTNAASNVQL